MTSLKRQITRADILSIEDYAAIRKSHKQKLIGIKKDRRVSVGPDATFYFENYDTMWGQVQEMLYIEKGGEEQIRDELEAFNPLIPNGSEFVATFMLEIDDPVKRDKMLRKLGHIEINIYISIGGDKIYANPEQDVERTTDDGKTSAVHFLHFQLTEEQITAFSQAENDILVGIDHADYGHMAQLSPATRASLTVDIS